MNSIIKTGKTVLNALAFANVGNLNEFKELLRETPKQASCGHAPEQCKPVAATAPNLTVVPTIKPIQQAL